MTAKYHLDLIVAFMNERDASAEVKGHADVIYERLAACEKLSVEHTKLQQDYSTLYKEHTKLKESNMALSLAILPSGGRK